MDIKKRKGFADDIYTPAQVIVGPDKRSANMTGYATIGNSVEGVPVRMAGVRVS